LADVNQDGNLNEQEFAIAMHLIHYKMAGGEVPTQLPQSLLASVKLSVGPSTAIIAPPQPALVIPEIHLPDINISVTIPSIPQLDTSPINPYPLSELSDKFGISDIIMTAYDPSNDIQRTQSEVQTSAVAQQVLDQAEPELKNLNMKLETLTVLQRTLQDKSVALNNQLSLADSQRVQILTLVQDYHNQIEQVEHELQHQYQDLVQLKNNLESYSSMGVGDVNSLRMLRTQLTQEQTELTTQLDAIREEKTRTLAELDITRKEVERICAETAQMPDTSSITRSMAAMTLFNQPENNLIGPTVNMNTLPQYSGFVDPRHGLPGYTGVTMAQPPEDQEGEIGKRRVEPKKTTDKKSRDKTSSGPAVNDKLKKDKDKKKEKEMIHYV
jgi:epidermal growth factor receptor substrate 15